jgi:transposase-like protein
MICTTPGRRSLRPTRDQRHAQWLDYSVRVEDIASLYGVSETTVSGWARRYGLPQRRGGIKPVIDRSRVDEFRTLWLQSQESIADLAIRFGASRSSIIKWADTLGLGLRRTRPVYVRSSESSEDDALEQGPQWGDPLPEQIAEMSAYCRARRVIAGEPCYVFVEPPIEED